MDYLASFSKLAKAVKPAHKGAEDYIDRLNYVITPILLIATASIIGAKQYVFQPIQCWSEQEFDGHRMEYAENYCWVENTYALLPHVSYKADQSTAPEARSTLYYYQWVPLILLSQAALFYVPHLMWLFLSNNTGVDLRQMASHAGEVYNEHDSQQRDVKVKFLALLLRKFLFYRKRYDRQNCCKRLVSLMFGRPSFSMYLACTYLYVKVMYIVNCLLQLQLMSSFLGLNMLFGFNLLNKIRNEETWHKTNIFPRVTMCSFSVRTGSANGQLRKYHLQCVLPVNMLNEKFYIMIWFWVAIVLTFNLVSIIQWAMHLVLSPSRRHKVKKYLKIGAELGSWRRDRVRESEFVNQFLKTDGAFLLSVIKKNAGDIATSEIVLECFKAFEASCEANGGEQVIKSAEPDSLHGVAV